MDNVILNKSRIIERCIHRIREEYADSPSSLNDITKQDSIVLNIQRACEAAIDLAMRVVAEHGLGLPQTSRDAFDLLRDEKFIDDEIAEKLKRMVGFRNIAVHDYQKIQVEIISAIIEEHLDDLLTFTRQIISR